MTIFKTNNSKLSILQQRLLYAKNRFKSPIYFVENVPVWKTNKAYNFLNTKLAYEYAPSKGFGKLIDVIIDREVKKYKLNKNLQNVAITNGGMHALSLSFRQIASRRPCSAVLCIAPVFIGVANAIELASLSVDYLKSNLLTLNEIESKVKENTSCIYINSPHNPSGDFCSKTFIKKLVEFVLKRNLYLVFDAVYDSYVFNNTSLSCPFNFIEQNDLIYNINSISKNYGLPGLRIGWISSSKKNIKDLLYTIENECVAICSVAQDFAINIIKEGNKELYNNVSESRMIVENFVKSINPEFKIPPAGTQIALPLNVDDIESFADFALSNYGLVLTTGSNYKGVERNFVRIPTSYLEKHTKSALTVLNKSLQEYSGCSN